MLENTVESLRALPREVHQLRGRVEGVEAQILLLRTEMREGFSAIRAEVAVEVLAPTVGYKRSSRRRWHSSRHQGVRSQEWWEARATLLLKQKEAQREAPKEAQKERGSIAMEINWMGRGKRGADDARENGSASGTKGT